MNHDLIAAGHPRLTFEYTAYHELLPRHWRDKASEAEPWEDKSKKFGPDFEAKAWLIGQATTAKAATELTAARARLAGQAAHSWPEFTDYGCFACHHDLKPKETGDIGSTWRQHPRFANVPPGSLPWGTWVRPEPEALSPHGAYFGAPGGEPFADLAALLSQPSPDPKQVSAKCDAAIRRLSEWHPSPPDRAGIRNLLADLAADGMVNRRDWDDAAQNYSRDGRAPRLLTEFDPSSANARRRDLFLGLRKVLAYPPAAGDRGFNSPDGFTPEKYQQAPEPFASEFRKPDAPCTVTPLLAPSSSACYALPAVSFADTRPRPATGDERREGR